METRSAIPLELPSLLSSVVELEQEVMTLVAEEFQEWVEMALDSLELGEAASPVPEEPKHKIHFLTKATVRSS